MALLENHGASDVEKRWAQTKEENTTPELGTVIDESLTFPSKQILLTTAYMSF